MIGLINALVLIVMALGATWWPNRSGYFILGAIISNGFVIGALILKLKK